MRGTTRGQPGRPFQLWPGKNSNLGIDLAFPPVCRFIGTSPTRCCFLLQSLILLREITVNYMAPIQARFLVRRGSTDWMVYDRERKGAAQLKDYSLTELAKEQAEQIKQRLAIWSCQPT